MVWQEENIIEINYTNKIVMENASRVQPSNLVCEETYLSNICKIARVHTTIAKEFQKSNIVSNLPLCVNV